MDFYNFDSCELMPIITFVVSSVVLFALAKSELVLRYELFGQRKPVQPIVATHVAPLLLEEVMEEIEPVEVDISKIVNDADLKKLKKLRDELTKFTNTMEKLKKDLMHEELEAIKEFQIKTASVIHKEKIEAIKKTVSDLQSQIPNTISK